MKQTYRAVVALFFALILSVASVAAQEGEEEVIAVDETVHNEEVAEEVAPETTSSELVDNSHHVLTIDLTDLEIDQEEARNGLYSDPGWTIKDTINRDIIISIRDIPRGLRRGDVGEYQLDYYVFEEGADVFSDNHIAIGHRSIRVKDIDECSLGKHDCDVNARCENTDGRFRCHCNPGWRGDGVTCVNINECLEGTDDCPPNSECIDTPGSFYCKCLPGFIENRVDDKLIGCIDPCVDQKISCGPHSYSVRVGDTCICECYEGFEKDEEGNCVDIDECERQTHDCPPNSDCKNTEGSYECICRPGYRKVNDICVNIDECAEGTHTCAENQDCIDTDGSYICKCRIKDGWEEDPNDATRCVYTLKPIFNLHGPEKMEIPQFSIYKEQGYNIVDKEDDTIRMEISVPSGLDGIAIDCGKYIINYKTTNGRGFSWHRQREVTVTPVDQCKLESSHPFAAKCGDFAKCKYNARECKYDCVCPLGYKPDGSNGCIDEVPPIFKGKFQDPYFLYECVVCQQQVGESPDLEKPVITEAYDPHPFDESLNEPVEVTLETVPTDRNYGDEDVSCIEHHYSAEDKSGNRATKVLTVCKKSEDMRKVIMEMKELYDLQIWLIRVTGYALFVSFALFLMWYFGGYVGPVVRVFLVDNEPVTEVTDDLVTAYTVWFRLWNPFSSSSDIKKKVYAKIDLLMDQ